MTLDFYHRLGKSQLWLETELATVEAEIDKIQKINSLSMPGASMTFDTAHAASDVRQKTDALLYALHRIDPTKYANAAPDDGCIQVILPS